MQRRSFLKLSLLVPFALGIVGRVRLEAVHQDFEQRARLNAAAPNADAFIARSRGRAQRLLA